MILPNNILYVIMCFVLCVLGSQGKPSLSFNFPSFRVFSGFGTEREERDVNLKKYSGKRVANDTTRMVYFHDQTISIVELGPKKLLLNCELIEVYDPEEAFKTLSDLQDISKPLLITFREMRTLMSQCQEIDAQTNFNKGSMSSKKLPGVGRGILTNNPLTLFSGIIPGTKWCGTGDIAKDYHDLGAEKAVDRCCRTHDLCPVKVRGYSRRYNLTNNSLYTKSHCRCDDDLYDCLRSSDSPTAHLMGNIYFNLIQVPCVEESKKGREFRRAKNTF